MKTVINNASLKEQAELINALIKNHKSAQFITSRKEMREHLINSVKNVAEFCNIEHALKSRSAPAALSNVYYVIHAWASDNRDSLKLISNFAMIEKVELLLEAEPSKSNFCSQKMAYMLSFAAKYKNIDEYHMLIDLRRLTDMKELNDILFPLTGHLIQTKENQPSLLHAALTSPRWWSVETLEELYIAIKAHQGNSETEQLGLDSTITDCLANVGLTKEVISHSCISLCDKDEKEAVLRKLEPMTVGNLNTNAYQNLIQYAFDNGCTVHILDDDNQELIDFNHFSDANRAVIEFKQCDISIRENNKPCGVACVDISKDEFETVTKHFQNKWFDSWLDQYIQNRGEQ